MRSLRHLSAVHDNLVGDSFQLPEEVPAMAGVLPFSLETLHLHWGQWYCSEEGYRRRCRPVNDAVRKLLEHGHMPNLRQVRIERYYHETLEGGFDGQVAERDMTDGNRHLWMIRDGSGCRRIIVTFRRED